MRALGFALRLVARAALALVLVALPARAQQPPAWRGTQAAPVVVLDANGNPLGGSVQALTSSPFSGTVAAANAFQQALAQNATRKGCYLLNPVTASENLLVFFGACGAATQANAIPLPPGQPISCAAGSGVLTDPVCVAAATAGHGFVGFAQ